MESVTDSIIIGNMAHNLIECVLCVSSDVADGHSSLLRVVCFIVCGRDRSLTHPGGRTRLLSPGSATHPPPTEVQILASHQSGEAETEVNAVMMLFNTSFKCSFVTLDNKNQS